MGKKLIVFLVLIISSFLIGCQNKNESQPLPDKSESQPTSSAEINYYTQGSNNRTAAEWEPALGTLIVWPLSIPYKLVVELASDNHLYTMVENEDARKEAEKWYDEWHISPENVTYIYAKQGVDAW